LHANIEEGVWIIAGYKLMITILLVMFGRLADLYGRVKLYNLGFVIFTIGSLLCALSQNGEQLIIFRFLQGAGAALLISKAPPLLPTHSRRNNWPQDGNKHDGGELRSRCRLHSQRHNDYLFRLAVMF